MRVREYGYQHACNVGARTSWLRRRRSPCLEAYCSGAQVRIPDVSLAVDRWPRFVAAVAQRRAYASVHAIPLRLRGQAIG